MATWSVVTALMCAEIVVAVNEGKLPLKEPALHEHPTLVAMVEESNSWRARYGLGPHRISPHLMEVAQNHANWMAASNRFQHNYDHSYPEIIYWNAADIPSVFAGWINSGPHRNIMMSGNTHVGYGYAVAPNGQTYWCGVFGSFSE